MSEPMILMRMSKELLEQLFTRDAECNRLTLDVQPPGGDGISEVRVDVNYSDNPLAAARDLAADLLNQACARTIEDGKTEVIDDLGMSTYEAAVDYFVALGWLSQLPDGRDLYVWSLPAHATGENG